MATLYIHGGMQKTGTTAIQHFLASNRAALKEQGAAYPDFSDICDWIADTRNAHWLLRGRYSDEVCKKAAARIGELAKTYAKIILSDEELWRREFCDADFWSLLTELFAPYDITIKMVVYLRRQDQYLYSNWAQSVKSTVDVSFKTLSFAEYIETGYYKQQPLDYQDALGRIENALGREHMLVRVYERRQFSGEDHTITSDFLQTVGLDASRPYEAPERVANVSLTDSVLEAKRYLNRVPGFTRTEHLPGNLYERVLLKVQRQMQEEGRLQNRTGFSRQDRMRLMENYADSNAAAASRYLGREDGILFYEPIADGEDADETFTTEELVEVCGRVIEKLCEKNHSLRERKDEVRASNQKYSEKLRVSKEKLREEKESNKQLRAQIEEQERQIRSMQHELDSSIFKLAAKRVFRKRS